MQFKQTNVSTRFETSVPRSKRGTGDYRRGGKPSRPPLPLSQTPQPPVTGDMPAETVRQLAYNVALDVAERQVARVPGDAVDAE